jgi:hypothetical protein
VLRPGVLRESALGETRVDGSVPAPLTGGTV